MVWRPTDVKIIVIVSTGNKWGKGEPSKTKPKKKTSFCACYVSHFMWYMRDLILNEIEMAMWSFYTVWDFGYNKMCSMNSYLNSEARYAFSKKQRSVCLCTLAMSVRIESSVPFNLKIYCTDCCIYITKRHFN
jgi:hypothetical protein